ncbi:MAG: S1 RNA-binding domain-containing protein, partial [Planctomycetaceae bacterium]|nr:S1 RNA-binding domain-containing protein [Planctomycetaceae bacterium]
NDISDLSVGMVIEGAVTNVTKFGAFVDIGVHQDGLIHVSQLADHFVRDPSEIVAVGDIVKVTVLEIDSERRRIALSRKSGK